MSNISKIDSAIVHDGTKKISNLVDKIWPSRILSKYEKVTEYGRGRIVGRELNKRDAAAARAAIQREVSLCNVDCLKGLLETLNKDLAKQAYGLK